MPIAVAPGCQKSSGDNQVATAGSESRPILGLDTRIHPIGEIGRTRDYSMSVDSVKECPMDPPFSPKHGNTKFGVEVSIKGESEREVPVNVFYATLVDARGDSYSATLAGCEPPLVAVRVANGKSTHGFVTFEVPKAAEKFELRYAPMVIGPGTEELKFSVSR